jgi:hypothetical protein
MSGAMIFYTSPFVVLVVFTNFVASLSKWKKDGALVLDTT